MKQWTADLSRVAVDLWHTTLTYLPRVAAALLLLLAGWVTARLLRAMTHRLVRRVGRWGSIEGEVRASGVEDVAPKIVSTIAFWVVFLAFLAAAGQVLGLAVVSTVLSQLTVYLPRVLSGVVVVLAGVVVGNVARHTASSAAAAARVAYSGLLGEIARVAVLAIAGVIALEQFGIDSTVLVVAFGLVIGGAVGGVALAFGLGCRDAVSDLIAGRHLSRTYRPGQRVKVGDLQGRIIRLAGSSVTIDTGEGKATVPARLFVGTTSVLLDEEG